MITRTIKTSLVLFLLTFAFPLSLYAQTHTAVPIKHPVYHILEQAQLRGLLRFQPSAKPYSKAVIISLIDEILANDSELRFGVLAAEERRMLQQFKVDFNPPRDGLNLTRGTYATEHTWNDIYFSGEAGLGLNFEYTTSYFPFAGGFKQPLAEDPDDTDTFAGADHPASGDSFWGINTGFDIQFKGDLGRNTSYGLLLAFRILRAPRPALGRYNTYSADWYDRKYYINRLITTYSEPLTAFPYTYEVMWDGSVWYWGHVDASGFEGWPQTLSIGYFMLPEMAGQFLNGHVTYRIASIDREWGSMSNNGSLMLNQTAKPFIGAELTFIPFTWLSFSSITGALEFGWDMETTRGGIKNVAATFQNFFSMNILELNYKNYFHVGLGGASVWAKRFELGQIFPLADTFLYQQNGGDFDNSGFLVNLMGQYPGIAKSWFSLFMDEISLGEVDRNFFSMSRMMIAFQFGTSFTIPQVGPLSFNLLTIRYTKVEPFNYSHTREILPWYGDLLMETNWVTAGRALGFYTPPNSDEILIRFDTMPAIGAKLNFQYQLIRHGADYGDRAVFGSSLWSELDPTGRKYMRKYFLHDGAYQWMHIYKLGGEYSFASTSNLPFRLFAEIGLVHSYFTDIDSDIAPNSGKSSPYQVINTPQYPHSLQVIGTIGVHIFPKF